MEKSNNDKYVEKLFSLNAHLGHRKNRLHPKAKGYVYKTVDGVSVIDLTKTVHNLEEAKKFLKEEKKQKHVLLLVATKKIINQIALKLSEEYQIPRVTNKWLPGLLTNFETIIKNVKKLNRLEKEKQEGTWTQYIKHERVKLEKEVIKLKRLYGGIAGLEKKPDIILIVDIKKEKNALNEARLNNIKTIAILDTNANPDLVDFPIVANDDSDTALEFLLRELIGAYTDKPASPADSPISKPK